MLKVVLVEDNSADVFLINRALHEAGLQFTLQTFDNGEEAMKFLERRDESAVPDVFVMDWNLPRVHGKEILRAISCSDPFRDAPRVVLTSSDSPVDRGEVERLGGIFFNKPRTLEEFMAIGRKIQAILQAR